jgi:hypothetical protein
MTSCAGTFSPKAWHLAVASRWDFVSSTSSEATQSVKRSEARPPPRGSIQKTPATTLTGLTIKACGGDNGSSRRGSSGPAPAPRACRPDSGGQSQTLAPHGIRHESLVAPSTSSGMERHKVCPRVRPVFRSMERRVRRLRHPRETSKSAQTTSTTMTGRRVEASADPSLASRSSFNGAKASATSHHQV